MRIVELETPNGNRVRYSCRPDTNDADLVRAVVGGDEYQLAGRRLEGYAIDVGAHIGGVAVALAVDFPDLVVVALEPVPENRAALERNATLNETPGVIADGRAASSPEAETVFVRYGYLDDPRYRYIGGLYGDGRGAASNVAVAGAASLSRLLDDYGIAEAAFLKIDCEGCEWGFLADPAVARVREIAGEIHGAGDEFDRIAELLGATHDLEVDRARYLFQAVRR